VVVTAVDRVTIDGHILEAGIELVPAARRREDVAALAGGLTCLE
jgi:hypothetical protein